MLDHSRISVVICAHTEERWHDLCKALESIQNQVELPDEIIVVIDHNLQLLEKVKKQYPQVKAIENREQKGASGSKNSGVLAAIGNIIAFLDDDARADPEWLSHLKRDFCDPSIVGVGGFTQPAWAVKRPEWFPEEFYWVLGCSHKGLPEGKAQVRNLIACNMAVRKCVFDQAGGFLNGIGPSGGRALGCEDTEFCIRVHQTLPESAWLYQPKAKVWHNVPPARASWRYFIRRCFGEGQSKALITRYIGTKEGLSWEREAVLKNLPAGILKGLTDAFFRKDPAGLARASAIIAGLSITVAGFVFAKASTGNFHQDQKGFQPVKIVEIELSRPLPAISSMNPKTGGTYSRALCLLRYRSEPVGQITLSLASEDLKPDAYAPQIWELLGSEINPLLNRDGFIPASGLTCKEIPGSELPVCNKGNQEIIQENPFVSLVVATRDRPNSLDACLRSLLQLNYPRFEIILVDTPSTRATADLFQKSYSHLPNLRYMREDRPGISLARNRGLEAARGEIIFFTDDDTVVDPDCISEVARVMMAYPKVACVTGLVFPLELETQAQAWFESHTGSGKGFHSLVFDRAASRSPHPLYPYAAGIFGAGVHRAFRTSILRSLGGFDRALGPGSLGRAAEDFDIYFRVIEAGYQIAYEPRALVYHAHRLDYPALQKQIYAYSVGIASFLTKCIISRPERVLDLLRKIPYGLWYVFSPKSQKNRNRTVDYPKSLKWTEILGLAYGFLSLAYIRSRLHVNKELQVERI